MSLLGAVLLLVLYRKLFVRQNSVGRPDRQPVRDDDRSSRRT